MKIDHNSTKKIKFSEVPAGQIFQDGNGQICMRARTWPIGALNLVTGEFHYFDSGELVTPYPNAFLTLERIEKKVEESG